METRRDCPGFEQGPIRPPSEATSLLVRVTRNCPWNRCTFCPVYKEERFSRRSVEDVLVDVSRMRETYDRLLERAGREDGEEAVSPSLLARLLRDPETSPGCGALVPWLAGGGRTAFLQDADSLIVPPLDLARILRALRRAFPSLERVTCYARARTLARRTVADLVMLREAGLDRVHVGLESGSDAVLRRTRKGCTARQAIDGGRRVVDAGLELSEYVIPGLGGRVQAEEHARETARVLNAIDPHFIRLRSLAVPEGSPLAEEVSRGEFEWPWETEVVREIRTLVERLEDVRSTVVSDHALNLLMEVRGTLPGDKPVMLAVLDQFLSLSTDQQEIFIVGRRSGILRDLGEMRDPVRRRWAADRRARLLDQGKLEPVLRGLVRRFI